MAHGLSYLLMDIVSLFLGIKQTGDIALWNANHNNNESEIKAHSLVKHPQRLILDSG